MKTPPNWQYGYQSHFLKYIFTYSNKWVHQCHGEMYELRIDKRSSIAFPFLKIIFNCIKDLFTANGLQCKYIQIYDYNFLLARTPATYNPDTLDSCHTWVVVVHHIHVFMCHVYIHAYYNTPQTFNHVRPLSIFIIILPNPYPSQDPWRSKQS